VRFHGEPGDAEPGSPCDLAQPSCGRGVPTFKPIRFRMSRLYEGNIRRERWSEKNREVSRNETAAQRIQRIQRIQGCASVRRGASKLNAEA
jgi:hypothetical protein